LKFWQAQYSHLFVFLSGPADIPLSRRLFIFVSNTDQEKEMIKQAFTTAIVSLLIINASNAQTMERNSFTAKGSFTVKVAPVGQPVKNGELSTGTYSVDKVFSGDLQAASKFEMHSVGTDAGAGAYVAIEIVTGTLNGKTGSFALMHNGTMTKTSQQLTITIVPECATGELKGMEGKFTINIVGKEHFYVMEYTLPK
jgi:hypothetical protein